MGHELQMVGMVALLIGITKSVTGASLDLGWLLFAGIALALVGVLAVVVGLLQAVYESVRDR